MNKARKQSPAVSGLPVQERDDGEGNGKRPEQPAGVKG